MGLGKYEFERALEQGEADWIFADGFLAFDRCGIILVPSFGDSWEPAFFNFGLQAALDVLGQVSDELIGHAQFHGHHEHIVGGEVPALMGLDVLEDVLLEHPADVSAIHWIARESIQFPAQDAVGFAAVDASKQVAENGPPWSFGGLGFRERVRNVQVVALGNGLEFLDLGVNGCDLPIFAFCGFAGVDEVFGWGS